MSGIGHALVNLFTVSTVLYWDQRENTAHFGKYSTVEINTENCIVFATTGHVRFEHARVLNNKTRAIPGITVRRYRSRSIPRQLNHCITGIIHTFTASTHTRNGRIITS